MIKSVGLGDFWLLFSNTEHYCQIKIVLKCKQFKFLFFLCPGSYNISPFLIELLSQCGISINKSNEKKKNLNEIC